MKIASLLLLIAGLLLVTPLYSPPQKITYEIKIEVIEMINRDDIENTLIRPVLKEMNTVLPGAYSESAVQLLLGTLAQESDFGYSLTQTGASSTIGAKGIWQIETPTHIGTWNNYLKYRPKLADWVRSKASQFALDDAFLIDEEGNEIFDYLENSEELDRNLTFNMEYGLIIARLKYWRGKGALPDADDIEGQGVYYKRVYNTSGGKGSAEEYVISYNRFVM